MCGIHEHLFRMVEAKVFQLDRREPIMKAKDGLLGI
jgi:hypothetical protein